MKIYELIPELNIEDYKTEFKGIIQEGPKKDSSERYEYGWLKTVVAFANSDGGTFYIGVDNKTHDILSLTHEQIDKISLMFQRLVLEHVEPPINYKIEHISIPQTSPLRYILKITIFRSKFPPISLKINGIASIFVRHFAKTSPATGEEIRNMVMNNEFVSFDLLETEEIYNPKDFSTLHKFYEHQNDGKKLTNKDLINIGFMNVDLKLKRGSLLFKDNFNESRTMVECSLFKGINKGDNIFVANERFALDLISEYQRIVSFIINHSASGYQKTSEGNISYISFPKRSVLEAVINALAHRNYFITSGQTEINIYKDRLEIISPGSLLNSKWLIKETNLSNIPPLRRNNLICEVFAMLKLMDRKGSGFDKIIEEYKPYGTKFAPYADANETSFSITLPDLTHSGGLVANSDMPSLSIVGDVDVKFAEKILSYCYFTNRTIGEIASFLSIKASTYFRKNIINPLVNNNYLIPNIDSYPTTYRTNTTKVIPD